MTGKNRRKNKHPQRAVNVKTLVVVRKGDDREEEEGEEEEEDAELVLRILTLSLIHISEPTRPY